MVDAAPEFDGLTSDEKMCRSSGRPSVSFASTSSAICSCSLVLKKIRDGVRSRACTASR